jgi:CBS domain-containing protein
VLNFDGTKLYTEISQLLNDARKRPIPMVREEANIDDIIALLVHSTHSRVLYVVDQQRKLKGTISLGMIVKHVFSHRQEPRIHGRVMMDMITSETAHHMMRRHPVFAMEKDRVESVLRRMIRANLEEIAVLNAGRQVIGDVTMVDLLAFLRDSGQRTRVVSKR